jgi:thioredoxin 1
MTGAPLGCQQTGKRSLRAPLYFLKYTQVFRGAEMAGNVSEVTDNNFQAEVLESDVPVLVDFWAPWCGPCRMVGPVVEEIATEKAGQLKVSKLNTDENQQTAIQYNVLSIPTLIVFKNGQEVKRVTGAYPKKRLEAEIEPALA